jgi:hypothetical protein
MLCDTSKLSLLHAKVVPVQLDVLKREHLSSKQSSVTEAGKVCDYHCDVSSRVLMALLYFLFLG